VGSSGRAVKGILTREGVCSGNTELPRWQSGRGRERVDVVVLVDVSEWEPCIMTYFMYLVIDFDKVKTMGQLISSTVRIHMTARSLSIAICNTWANAGDRFDGAC